MFIILTITNSDLTADKKDGEEVEVAEKKSDEGDERKKKNKSVSESTKELQMD